MQTFYSRPDLRTAYQRMLNEQENQQIPRHSVRSVLVRYLASRAPRRLLEVGCGNARVYRELVSEGYRGAYVGLDVEADLLAANRVRHQEAEWHTGSVYAMPFAAERFDACFSLYVLEHLVYPERALREMLRVLAPSGELLLVFPDFVASGILPSQTVGLSPKGSAREKLRDGRPLDAAISLWDSRVRVRRGLRRATERYGPFPVNTRPLCLDRADHMAPDVDAVYIASLREIKLWGEREGLVVGLPGGATGEFETQAFVSLRKPNGDGR